MTHPRIVLERETLAHFLRAPSLELLRRWLLGLELLGIGTDQFSGDLGRAFAAIVALAARGEQIDVESVSRESGIDTDHLAWIASAYGDGELSLQALALNLLDADRRARVESLGACLQAVARDPSADLDRECGRLLGALRRVGRDAA